MLLSRLAKSRSVSSRKISRLLFSSVAGSWMEVGVLSSVVAGWLLSSGGGEGRWEGGVRSFR